MIPSDRDIQSGNVELTPEIKRWVEHLRPVTIKLHEVDPDIIRRYVNIIDPLALIAVNKMNDKMYEIVNAKNRFNADIYEEEPVFPNKIYHSDYVPHFKMVISCRDTGYLVRSCVGVREIAYIPSEDLVAYGVYARTSETHKVKINRKYNGKTIYQMTIFLLEAVKNYTTGKYVFRHFNDDLVEHYCVNSLQTSSMKNSEYEDRPKYEKMISECFVALPLK